jgi:tetratricopeptide (TPR) repeat protein
MTRIQRFVGLLFFSVVIAPDVFADKSSDRQRDFLRSIELFDAAKSPDDFRESAKLLESIIADGFCNGAVYYNCGNAYYRAGDFGRAILNYRKAKPYRPSDPLLEANLQQAIVSAPGKLPEAPRAWWDHVLFWTESIAYPNRVAIALGLLVLAPLFALCAMLFQRRKLLWIAGAITGVAMLFVIDAVLNSPEKASRNRAVITGETVARKGIGKDYEAAFDAPLKDGAEFVVLQETNGWTFGHFSGIGDGWVRNEFVAR